MIKKNFLNDDEIFFSLTPFKNIHKLLVHTNFLESNEMQQHQQQQQQWHTNRIFGRWKNIFFLFCFIPWIVYQFKSILSVCVLFKNVCHFFFFISFTFNKYVEMKVCYNFFFIFICHFFPNNKKLFWQNE